MKPDPVKCPTCGRRPSERMSTEGFVSRGGAAHSLPSCPDPIHDLADRLVARIETVQRYAPVPEGMNEDPDGVWLHYGDLTESEEASHG